MLFFRNEKPRTALILDVTSSSVGFCFVQISKKNLPKIIYFERSSIFFNSPNEITTFIKTINELFRKVVKSGVENLRLKKDLPKNVSIYPDEIHVMYGSPWYANVQKEISLSRETPFVFNENVFDKLTKNIQIPKNLVNDTMIEKTITDISMNGYNVLDPFGKKSNSISASVYMGFLSKETQNSIESIIKEFYNPHIKIEHHTHPLTMVYALKNMFGVEDCTIIDMNGEITEISVLRSGGLQSTFTVPMGSHYVLRKIIESEKQEKQIIQSKIKIIFEGHSDTETNKNIISNINVLAEEWSNKISEITKNSYPEGLPRTLCVFADDATLPTLSLFIKNDSVKKNLFGGYDPLIKYNSISPDTKPMIDSVGDFDSRDLFLIHACYYLHFTHFNSSVE